ncbi:hypothetical protein RUR49_14745 [Pseudoxanthobacter sp. M-2]|uniref:hypothetical protein n=1 Tax=Pseudoxanthobacter sp. M-2 TaxID=3078754 RepID=UPI0038FC8B0C
MRESNALILIPNTEVPSDGRTPFVERANSIDEILFRLGISRAKLYMEIGNGRIVARKIGARTIILESDLRSYLASLPRVGE